MKNSSFVQIIGFSLLTACTSNASNTKAIATTAISGNSETVRFDNDYMPPEMLQVTLPDDNSEYSQAEEVCLDENSNEVACSEFESSNDIDDSLICEDDNGNEVECSVEDFDDSFDDIDKSFDSVESESSVCLDDNDNEVACDAQDIDLMDISGSDDVEPLNRLCYDQGKPVSCDY